MKIEECKEVIHKSEKFSGHEYILEDKDILLNSINVLAIGCSSYSSIKDICDFSIRKIADNKYRIFISTIVDLNEFIINYGVLRNVKKLTLSKNEYQYLTKTTNPDGSLEITFLEDKGE